MVEQSGNSNTGDGIRDAHDHVDGIVALGSLPPESDFVGGEDVASPGMSDPDTEGLDPALYGASRMHRRPRSHPSEEASSG